MVSRDAHRLLPLTPQILPTFYLWLPPRALTSSTDHAAESRRRAPSPPTLQLRAAAPDHADVQRRPHPSHHFLCLTPPLLSVPYLPPANLLSTLSPSEPHISPADLAPTSYAFHTGQAPLLQLSHASLLQLP